MVEVVDVAEFVRNVSFDAAGLVPAVAQQWDSGEVLMLAWMSRESLERTIESGCATYYSRSRGRLWQKGESSGHVQRVRDMNLDCDGDAIVLHVEQLGPACHTGLRSCFDTMRLVVGKQ